MTDRRVDCPRRQRPAILRWRASVTLSIKNGFSERLLLQQPTHARFLTSGRESPTNVFRFDILIAFSVWAPSVASAVGGPSRSPVWLYTSIAAAIDEPSLLAVRTNDLHSAARPRMNREPEAVQLYDRGDQIEPKAHARRVSHLVGAIET